MDEITNGEQPVMEQANVSDETSNESAASLTGSSNQFGKFKTAEALIEAYRSLEAEFTKKSQRLSEMEKEQTRQATRDKSEIESDLDKFLSQHSEASPYAERLKERCLAKDGKVDFDAQLALVMVESLASGKSKIDNPIIQKYVFQDEELTRHVLETYMKNLTSGKPPQIISGDNGQKVAGTAPTTPKSLTEAKKMVEEMFS